MTRDQHVDTMDEYSSAEADSVDGVPLTHLSGAPVPAGGLSNWLKAGRNLKFEVDPVDNSGVIYISSNPDQATNGKVFPEETKLYDFKIPDSITDDSDGYNEYLKSCFKNFEDLIRNKNYHEFMSSNKDSEQIGVIIDTDAHSKALRDSENQLVLNSTISKMVTDLSDLIEDKLSGQEDPEDPEFKLLQLEEIINVLNLIHALFFSTTDELLVLLVNWINRADIQPDLELVEEILGQDGAPYKNTLFWTEYVKKLITRGLFAQAVNVINESQYEALEDDDNDLFLIIQDLCVLLTNYDIVQFSADNREFVAWKQKCCELRDNFKNVSIEKKENLVLKNVIYEILLTMTGLPSAIVKSSTSWYECFLAKALFELPSETLLSEYLKSSLSSFVSEDDEESLFTWERACISLMQGNYLKVVKQLEVLDKPTATYVSTLFEARGLYSSYDFLMSEEDRQNETISELMLNEHALECLCHQKLIPIGVGILLSSNTPQTRSVIAQYLPNYHCKSNDDLEWCLSICAKLRLTSTASTILKINGNQLFDQGQLYESLVLYSKSGDLKVLTDKCWLIFENAILQSDPIHDDLINTLILDAKSLEDDFEISDALRQSLSPYAVFLQFLSAKKENKLVEAVSTLFNLLSFKYLPPKYFTLLLCQLLPFFKSGDSTVQLQPGHYLSKEQLVKLLELMNEFDEKFLSVAESLQGKSATKRTRDEQLIVSQYHDAQDLYKLSISDEYKNAVVDKEHDWRFQLQLIDEEVSRLGNTIEELSLLSRERISLQLGRVFLDE